MTVKQLRKKFDKVLEIGIEKSVGVENKDNWLIDEIDTDLKDGKVDGVAEKITQLEAIFKSL